MRNRLAFVITALLLLGGAAYLTLRPAPANDDSGSPPLAFATARLEQREEPRAARAPATLEVEGADARHVDPVEGAASGEADEAVPQEAEADAEARAKPNLEEAAAEPASPPATHREAEARPPPEAEAPPSLSREDIENAIEEVKPKVAACFEQALKGDPSLAGRVIVEFEIEAKDGEGIVTRGEVPEAETFSPIFEACVLRQVAGVRFPVPEADGKVTVRYPFLFDPGGGWGG